MSRNLEKINQHLERANECHNDKWQMWKYVAHNNTLILCGYKLSFKVTGFLIFYGTEHLCLPRWLEKPVFRVGDISQYRNSIQKELSTQPAHLISISANRRHYYVVCRGVEFYDVPEGAYV